MNNRNMIIFNQQNLSNWKNEAKDIQKKLGDCQTKISNRATQILRGNNILASKKDILRLETTINCFKERATELQELTSQAEDFLFNLKNFPEYFYCDFSDSLLKQLDDFDQEYPDQSVIVRICLTELKKKINFIKDKASDVNISEMSPEKRWQISFAELCGLLWCTLEKIHKSKENAKFIELILSALRSTHVARNGDLPDAMSIHQGCITLYKKLQQQNPLPLHDLSRAELYELESQEYKRAYDNLQLELLKIPQQPKELNHLHKKASAVANYIHHQKNTFSSYDTKHSIKMFTTTLQLTTALLVNPTDKQCQQKYENFANKDKGKPSFWKKLNGLMLTFLGAVIVAGSIFAAVASFGGSSPLSALGISIGVTAIAQGVSITAGCAGVSALAGGIGLFSQSVRRDLSKKMVDMAKATNKIQ